MAMIKTQLKKKTLNIIYNWTRASETDLDPCEVQHETDEYFCITFLKNNVFLTLI